MLEPLLAHESPGGEPRSTPSGTPRAAANLGALSRLRPEPPGVDPVGHDLDAAGSAPSAIARRAEVGAARRDRAGPFEHHPRRAPRRRERLGDVDVGAVQADDLRPQRRRGQRGEAAGNHPVAVHHSRTISAGHSPRGEPAGGQGQRRGDVRGAPQRDIRAQGCGISEHVQRSQRRVAIEMEADAPFPRRAG